MSSGQRSVDDETSTHVVSEVVANVLRTPSAVGQLQLLEVDQLDKP